MTAKELRGPRFRRLFADIHVDARVEVDYAVLPRAGYRLVEGRGVLGGFSAAELLGASCGPEGAPVEVVVPGARQKPQAGLRVSRNLLAPDEITTVGDARVTTPLRTAYDLARRSPLVEAVVALDALAHAHPFDPAEVVRFGYRYLGARGSAQLPEVARLSNRLADSPMETRIRMAVELAGLPPLVLQHPVGPYRLDTAYPHLMVAVEYDGRELLTPERALRDLAREALLVRAGRTVLRFRARVVPGHPERIAPAVRRVIAAALAGISCRSPSPRRGGGGGGSRGCR
jgi:very-short-patch-repair endonuclease